MLQTPYSGTVVNQSKAELISPTSLPQITGDNAENVQKEDMPPKEGSNSHKGRLENVGNAVNITDSQSSTKGANTLNNVIDVDSITPSKCGSEDDSVQENSASTNAKLLKRIKLEKM